MYQVEAWSALRLKRGAAGTKTRLAVSTNVIALGMTSLLTDVSSEMVSTILPVYLVLQLGLTPLQFGVVDGLYHGVTAFVRLLSGTIADRWQRHKEIAAVGYASSAICKLGLLLAGSAWPVLSGVVAVDRIGKGIRTAPRDALISLSTPPDQQATAFGVHRAFDSAGAMLGPLVALGILTMMPERFDVVFVTSFSVAIAGVGVLFLFARNVAAPARVVPVEAAPRPSLRVTARGLMPLLLVAGFLSVTTISDAFLYLLLQRQQGFNAGYFPLLYVGTAGIYLLLAVPAGRLADRAGRPLMLLAGHIAMAAAYLVTVVPNAGITTIVICLVLVGAYYAMTDGVLMALVSSLCEPAHRASGMAAVASVTSAGRFVAALAFGALWTRSGAAFAASSFAIALALAVAVAAVVLMRARHHHAFEG
jgi:MFS family permease